MPALTGADSCCPYRSVGRGRRSVLFFAIGLLLAATVPALARTTIVPDDFPTIQAAIDHLESIYASDTVLVRGGDYPERPVLHMGRVIRAIATANGTDQVPVIDGIQTPTDNGDDFGFIGLRFSGQVVVGPTNGPQRAIFRDCQFDAGAIPGGGHDYPDLAGVEMSHCTLFGTVWIRSQGATVDSSIVHGPLIMDASYSNQVRDNEFEGIPGTAVTVRGEVSDIGGNRVRGCGNGFDVVIEDGYSVFEDNDIEGCSNYAFSSYGYNGEPTSVQRNRITKCGAHGIFASGSLLVLDNTVTDCGGPGLDLQVQETGRADRHVAGNVVGRCGIAGIRLQYSNTGYEVSPVIRNNTVFSCAGPAISASGLSAFTISNNIAYSNRGPGLAVVQEEESYPTLSCNDWFANDGGATDGIAPSASDLAVEPGFCDLTRSDVQLMSNSPLLDAPGCGLIGALGKGCDPVPIALDLTPKTLNLASRGRWVTGYLQPAPPFAARDIDITTIRLNGTVSVDTTGPTALVDHDGDAVEERMVKFNRTALELTLPEGDEVPVTVTCKAGTTVFAGADTLRVRRGRFVSPASGAQMTVGSAAIVSWESLAGGHVHAVGLMLSADAGATWNLVAHSPSDNGSLSWTVPDTRTDRARLAVVSITSDNGNVEFADAVLAVSGSLSIAATTDVGDRDGGPRVLSIRKVSPNPAAHGRLSVEFVLRDGSAARLELLDVAGRVLGTRDIASPTPGGHALEFSDASALRPGIYFLRLRQNGSEARSRVAITR